MVLALLGPPGVGKGTQAERIAEKLEIPAISTGTMFREIAAENGDFGRALKRYLDSGELVPDDVVVDAVRRRTAKQDCAAGFVLDGFPRTLAQARSLDRLLGEQDRKLTAVLEFTAPTARLEERFTGRRVCPVDGSTYHLVTNPPRANMRCNLCGTELVQRADDAPDVVRRRLQVYRNSTAPLLEYYRRRGIVHAVRADAAPDIVSDRTFAAIGAIE